MVVEVLALGSFEFDFVEPQRDHQVKSIVGPILKWFELIGKIGLC